MNYKIVAGVDIGGSHITVSLVNLETFELIPGSYIREKVDSGADATIIIATWGRVIEKAFEIHPFVEKKIGIAMPGPFDYKKGISYMKNQGKYDSLYGLNIKELLAKQLDVAPEDIRFNNDAACFLQGEVYSGNVDEHSVAVGMTLGTGMGTAFMKGGQAFDADLWHMPFLDGVVEDYVSSRWFVKEFEQRAGIAIKDVKELIEHFPEHEKTKELFKEFSCNLSWFLYKFLKQKKGEVVIIGGNIAKTSRYFFQDVQRKLYEQIGYNVHIHFSVQGENAALIGGATQFYTSKKQLGNTL